MHRFKIYVLLKFSNNLHSFFFLKFSYLLDENMGSTFDNIAMNAMANKDNASNLIVLLM